MTSMGLNISFEEANKLVLENLENGKALEKLKEMVKEQKGDLDKLEVSETVISVKSKKTGFIKAIHTNELGEIVRKLGGGRYKKEDSIDPKVGMVLSVKQGDYILEDEEIVKVYTGDKDYLVNEILDCFEIDNTSGKIEPLVYELIK
jgi:pyrimidine-nucleoside phosphorylase